MNTIFKHDKQFFTQEEITRFRQLSIDDIEYGNNSIDIDTDNSIDTDNQAEANADENEFLRIIREKVDAMNCKILNHKIASRMPPLENTHFSALAEKLNHPTHFRIYFSDEYSYKITELAGLFSSEFFYTTKYIQPPVNCTQDIYDIIQNMCSKCNKQMDLDYFYEDPDTYILRYDII
jgi:hypothetical protein